MSPALFHKRGARVFGPRSVHEECRCSQKRFMLKFTPPEGRRDRVGDDGHVGITCEFCSRRYVLDPGELETEVAASELG